MRNMNAAIFRNILVMSIGRVLTGPIGFVTTILIARSLGPALYGCYSFAMSVAHTAAPFADLSLNDITLRKIARYPAQTSKWLTTLIAARMIAFSIIYSIIAIALVLMKVDFMTFMLSLLASLQLMALVFQAGETEFAARLDMRVPVFIRIPCSIAVLVAVLWLRARGGSAIQFMLAQIIGLLLNSGMVLMACFRRCGIELPSLSDIAHLFKCTAPFAIAGMFWNFGAKCIPIFLYQLRGREATGLYGAAYNVIEPATWIVGLVIQFNLFPAIAKVAGERHELKALFKKGWIALLILSSIIWLLLSINGHTVIHLLYGGRFDDATPMLTFLSPMFIIILTGAWLTYTAIALNMYRENFQASIAFVIFVIIMTPLFIAIWGAHGAAVARVITSAASIIFFISLFNAKFKGIVPISKTVGIISLCSVFIVATYILEPWALYNLTIRILWSVLMITVFIITAWRVGRV